MRWVVLLALGCAAEKLEAPAETPAPVTLTLKYDWREFGGDCRDDVARACVAASTMTAAEARNTVEKYTTCGFAGAVVDCSGQCVHEAFWSNCLGRYKDTIFCPRLVSSGSPDACSWDP